MTVQVINNDYDIDIISLVHTLAYKEPTLTLTKVLDWEIWCARVSGKSKIYRQNMEGWMEWIGLAGYQDANSWHSFSAIQHGGMR